MTVPVVLVGALLIFAGLLGLLVPELALAFVNTWHTGMHFVFGVSVRVVLGILLLAAASRCSQPTVVRVVGVIALVAALAMLVAGPARFAQVIGTFAGQPPGFMRAWSAVGMAFGTLLVWAGRRAR